MKKFILSFSILILVFASLGTAQTVDPIKYGVKAGVSIFELDIDSDLIDLNSRTGFSGGGFLVLDIPGIWAIQVEALYVQKGATSDGRVTDEIGQDLGDFTTTYQVDYLEFPLLARISLGTSPVHLLAGPAFAFNLTSKFTADDVPTLGGTRDIEEDMEYIASTDFGLILGAGAALPTSFGEVIFDLRYNFGMKNINDSEGVEMKNNGFLISAGVSF